MSKQITQSNHLKNYTHKIMELTKLYLSLLQFIRAVPRSFISFILLEINGVWIIVIKRSRRYWCTCIKCFLVFKCNKSQNTFQI
jgi:hypothetical protein